LRILFDQGVPLPLRDALTGRSVRTATQQGWDKLQNGELLEAAESSGFDVFVTTDQNLKYQQTLTGRRIAIVVLLKPQWPDLRHHAAVAAAAILDARPGEYLEVGAP
jgi:hypothetical protein